MVSYGIAKARAKAWRTDWNERTEITKAIITWADREYEYELEIANDDHMDDEEFKAWIKENAEEFAKEDAEESITAFEEIADIDFEEEYIDDDALFVCLFSGFYGVILMVFSIGNYNNRSAHTGFRFGEAFCCQLNSGTYCSTGARDSVGINSR